MAKITHIVLHYSATYEDQNLTVSDIDKMHRARGWKMVGYHYVIRRDGVVEQGRPETMTGAHVGGQNTGKIGICCIGGLDRKTGPNVGVDNRTPAQVESQIKLIRKLLRRYPGAKVVGHRDLAATQCPGFDVIPWWDAVQEDSVKAASNAVPTPTPRPAEPAAPARTEDKSVAKSKRFWTWLTTGGIGAVFTGLGALHPHVQLLLGGALVVFAAYAILTMPAVRKKLGLAS